MAAAKKRPRKAKAAEKATPKPSRLSRLLTTIWRPLPLLLAAVVLSGLMFWPEIVRQLPDLRRRSEYQMLWSRVTITPAGRWVPPDLTSQVQKRSGLPDPLSMLDENLVEQVANAFARHPWVAEVVSVAKTSPRQLNVELKYRTPVLMVRTQLGLYPVDRDGILLPPLDFALADAERFPIVEHVRSVPSGPAGSMWGDAAVLGAARLAEALIDERARSSAWETFGMAAIRVLTPERPAQALEEVTLGIRTTAGSQIQWGRPPGADTLEPTVEQKLLRLEKYLPKYGDVGYSTAPRMIDVWRWDVVQERAISRGTSETTRSE